MTPWMGIASYEVVPIQVHHRHVQKSRVIAATPVIAPLCRAAWRLLVPLGRPETE